MEKISIVGGLRYQSTFVLAYKNSGLELKYIYLGEEPTWKLTG